jgi:tyrosine-protein kinase Etk/Wzc
MNTESMTTKNEAYLIDYLLIPAKYCRMIIYATVIVTVLTYVFLFLGGNEYTAVCRALPPQQNLTLSAGLLDIMGGGVNYGQTTNYGVGGAAARLLGITSPDDIYLSMLKSNTVLNWVIERYNLEKIYKVKNIEDARNALLTNTKITLGKDRVIKIEVTNKDPKLAATLANAYLEELNHLLQQLSAHEAEDRLTFLNKEMAQINVNLSKAENALRKFGENKNVIQIDAQTKGTLDYIARLRAEIDAKEVQIRVMRQQAAPNNFDLIRLETELTGLKDKLKSAELQWDPSCTESVCVASSKVPALGLEYLRLMREAKFQENLYQIFTKMIEIARIDTVKSLTVVQVLDKATPPFRKSNKRLLPALLAGMATFFIMVFVAFGREYVDRLAEREDEARRLSLLVSYLKPDFWWWRRIKKSDQDRRDWHLK